MEKDICIDHRGHPIFADGAYDGYGRHVTVRFNARQTVDAGAKPRVAKAEVRHLINNAVLQLQA